MAGGCCTVSLCPFPPEEPRDPCLTATLSSVRTGAPVGPKSRRGAAAQRERPGRLCLPLPVLSGLHWAERMPGAQDARRRWF